MQGSACHETLYQLVIWIRWPEGILVSAPTLPAIPKITNSVSSVIVCFLPTDGRWHPTVRLSPYLWKGTSVVVLPIMYRRGAHIAMRSKQLLPRPEIADQLCDHASDDKAKKVHSTAHGWCPWHSSEHVVRAGLRTQNILWKPAVSVHIAADYEGVPASTAEM